MCAIVLLYSMIYFVSLSDHSLPVMHPCDRQGPCSGVQTGWGQTGLRPRASKEGGHPKS